MTDIDDHIENVHNEELIDELKIKYWTKSNCTTTNEFLPPTVQPIALPTTTLKTYPLKLKGSPTAKTVGPSTAKTGDLQAKLPFFGPIEMWSM